MKTTASREEKRKEGCQIYTSVDRKKLTHRHRAAVSKAITIQLRLRCRRLVLVMEDSRGTIVQILPCDVASLEALASPELMHSKGKKILKIAMDFRFVSFNIS